MDDHEQTTEVELYLLRHADAGDPMAWKRGDASRPISEKGEKQARALAKFLAKADFAPDSIVSSPKVRARQTAELVADAIKAKVRVDNRLGGLEDLETLSDVVTEAGGRRVVVVGHDPDLSELAAALTGVTRLPLKKGALARIDTSLPLRAGRGTLRWLVPPDLFG
jgi:phosphohistidine phosphatase